MTGMARKLALTAIAAIAASSVAFSPTVSAQPANPAVPQAFLAVRLGDQARGDRHLR